MIKETHLKYENVLFSSEVADMFTEIIIDDVISKKVLIYICKRAKEQQAKEEIERGTTINDVVENVEVARNIRQSNKGKGYSYINTKTNIQRKTAEKVVDKLLDMSLIYYRSVKPYKFLYPTKRGLQILGEISKKSKGDEKNG